MSLVVDLGITYRDGNLKPIDRLIIQRLEPLEDPFEPQDEVHNYQAYFSYGKEVVTAVPVTHRYGDGAWVLVQKALEVLK